MNGINDLRINTLLNKFNLTDRSITIDELNDKLDNIYKIDYSVARKVLENEREKSKTYLKKALNIK